MKVSDLKNIEEIKLVQDSFDDVDVVAGYTSDLLSDVMANALNGSILITIQAHKNTIAVCKLLDMKAVIICNDRETDEDFLASAKQENVAIFVTELNQYQASNIVGTLL